MKKKEVREIMSRVRNLAKWEQSQAFEENPNGGETITTDEHELVLRELVPQMRIRIVFSRTDKPSFYTVRWGDRRMRATFRGGGHWGAMHHACLATVQAWIDNQWIVEPW